MSNQQLIDAVRSNDLNQVRTLLGNGANPNARDIGVTALMLAARNGHLEISRMLIDRGADVNAIDGMNALMYGSKKGNREVVKTLLEKEQITR
jgi:ankyrin repeat protein